MAKNTPPYIVIGGGIAGLTAALALQDKGHRVVVYEATSHVGGRIDSRRTASSDGDPEPGCVETGMQFYYGGYREARRLLSRFGLAKSLVPISVSGQMHYRGENHAFSKTKPWLSSLSFRQHLSLYAKILGKVPTLLGKSVFDYTVDETADAIDTAQFFADEGASDLVELVARPLTNSYAFVEPEGHSLAMFLRILKLGATSGTYGLREGNDGLARAMAGELDVRQGRVTELLCEPTSVGCAVGGVSVASQPGAPKENVAASGVVLAVNGLQAAPLLKEAAPDAASLLSDLSYSSVLLVNLHLDRALTDAWVYVMSRRDGQKCAFGIDLMRRAPAMFPDGRSVIQVNIASPVSDDLISLGETEIVRQAVTDMERFIPNIAAMVSRTSVVRRAKAHPNFACGMQAQIREAQRGLSGLEGLAMAGDYLRAPLCEGAIRSGQDAARTLLSQPRTKPMARTASASALQRAS